jgi:hypothetical protein
MIGQTISHYQIIEKFGEKRTPPLSLPLPRGGRGWGSSPTRQRVAAMASIPPSFNSAKDSGRSGI